MKPKLIIINGLPGVGKTTLQKRIAADVELPNIGKDTIKEFLFDHLGSRDREWSRQLGVASIDMLHILAERLLLAGETVIIENAFYRSFAAPRLQAFCSEHSIPLLEIYCYTDEQTRNARFTNRTKTGERHPGHVDFENLKDFQDMELSKKYDPLQIGELIRFDTTNYTDKQYQQLLTQIRRFLATKQGEAHNV